MTRTDTIFHSDIFLTFGPRLALHQEGDERRRRPGGCHTRSFRSAVSSRLMTATASLAKESTMTVRTCSGSLGVFHEAAYHALEGARPRAPRRRDAAARVQTLRIFVPSADSCVATARTSLGTRSRQILGLSTKAGRESASYGKAIFRISGSRGSLHGFCGELHTGIRTG